jgi:FAD/FMN-containing dehydrogenase
MFVSCEGYGPLPEEKVQYLEEDLKELSGSLGLKPETAIGDAKAESLSALLSAPSADPYWKQRLKGGIAELFFLTTQGKVPEFVSAMTDMAQQLRYPAANIGAYIQPVVMGTSCHCEFDFYYNPDDAAAVEQTHSVVLTAADKLESMGAFFSRPYGDLAEVAYKQSQDTIDMQKKVKGIFDPNGILNPGQLCFR